MLFVNQVLGQETAGDSGEMSAAAASGREEAHQSLLQEMELQPFVEFLGKKKLPVKLQKIILYSICLIEKDQKVVPPEGRISTKEGIERLKRYVGAVGRFGNTPFLYPLYGISEYAQAFCRCVLLFLYFLIRREPSY
jgi:RAB protein geranylgeranyltransferase component A